MWSRLLAATFEILFNLQKKINIIKYVDACGKFIGLKKNKYAFAIGYALAT